MDKKKMIIITLLILFFAVAVLFIKNNHTARGLINNMINKVEGKTLNSKFNTKIKSGDLSTDYNVNEALSDIQKFNLNTINIPVIINIKTLSSNEMSVDKGSEEKAIKLIKSLRGTKVNIILEAYPWIANGSKYETNWNPENINTFFYNWKFNVLKILIDDIAVPYHIDALNIGSSFVHMEYAQSDWCDVVKFVRTYYKGLVTYKTGWWYTAKWDQNTIKEYQKKVDNTLFSKLDFISIAAYFELTNNDTNSTDNLVSAIQNTQIYDRGQNIKAEIEEFHNKWKKPIFFGELGFPKTIMASVNPWNPYQSNIINNTEQSNCFEAYRRTFENEQYLIGFSIFSIGEHSTDKRYYPSEESTKVIKDWYTDTKSRYTP